MLVEAAAATFLLAQFAYHRWFEDKPLKKIKPQEVSIPRVDEGTPVPLFYGRARMRGAILAWHSPPARETGDGTNGWPAGMLFYQMNMFFVVGIPFNGADGATTRIHGMWIGDRRCAPGTFTAVPGTSFIVQLDSATQPLVDSGTIGSSAVFYDGSPSQAGTLAELVALQTAAGVPSDEMTSYLGYATVLLFNSLSPWTLGSSTSIATYAFEASTYYDLGGYPAVGVMAQIGQDSNPVNVIYDLMTGNDFGKLGIDPALIDLPSFQTAATTCAQESHGYSMCIENVGQGAEHINDVLRQIDGALDVNPETGKWELRLVRPNYNPLELLHITKDNCQKLVGVAIGGSADIVNKVAVVYENREKDYADDVERDFNQGNATAQSSSEELQIEYRGCKTAALAKALAIRERAARSAPIFKFRAIVNREFRNLMRGDAVRVTYKGIAGLIFRVADVDRGTRTDRAIALDLVSDPFYTWRNGTPQSFPGSLVDTHEVHVFV